MSRAERIIDEMMLADYSILIKTCLDDRDPFIITCRLAFNQVRPFIVGLKLYLISSWVATKVRLSLFIVICPDLTLSASIEYIRKLSCEDLSYLQRSKFHGEHEDCPIPNIVFSLFSVIAASFVFVS